MTVEHSVSEVLLNHLHGISSECSSPPTTFFHYTRLDGLEGITKSGQLWATDVTDLEDSEEVKYGKGIVLRAIERCDPPTPFLKVALARTAVYVANTLDLSKVPGINLPRVRWFIACFCAHGDLPSQWKNYACNGEGYSLGFCPTPDPDDFLAPLFPALDCLDWAMVSILYDQKIQNAMIDEVLQQATRLDQHYDGDAKSNEWDLSQQLFDAMNREVTPESFSQLLFSALSNAMFKFKDPFYSPECEWRMTPRDVPKGLEIKHRTTKDGREIDYVKMRLRNLKLTEVMCGLYADKGEDEIQEILRQHGHKDVRVSRSTVEPG